MELGELSHRRRHFAVRVRFVLRERASDEDGSPFFRRLAAEGERRGLAVRDERDLESVDEAPARELDELVGLALCSGGRELTEARCVPEQLGGPRITPRDETAVVHGDRHLPTQRRDTGLHCLRAFCLLLAASSRDYAANMRYFTALCQSATWNATRFGCRARRRFIRSPAPPPPSRRASTRSACGARSLCSRPALGRHVVLVNELTDVAPPVEHNVIADTVAIAETTNEEPLRPRSPRCDHGGTRGRTGLRARAVNGAQLDRLEPRRRCLERGGHVPHRGLRRAKPREARRRETPRAKRRRGRAESRRPSRPLDSRGSPPPVRQGSVDSADNRRSISAPRPSSPPCRRP